MNNHRFLVFSSLIIILTFSFSGPAFADNASPQSDPGISFVRNIGGASAGDSLVFPTSVTTDLLGYMYVVDIDSNKVLKYNPSGTYVSYIGDESGDGQLDSPGTVAIDASRNLYVTDMNNDRVVKFDSEGNYVSQFGSAGSGDGQFDGAGYMTLDSAGNIYVSDWGNQRIQKFDRLGNYVSQFGSAGSGDGQLDGPFGLTTDPTGNIYVADSNNDRIEVFAPDGSYLSQFGTTGSGDGQFGTPTGVGIDVAGNIFVSDFFNNRVQKFDSDGNYLSQFTSEWESTEDGSFQYIYNLGVGVEGLIYVADGNGRIVVLQDNDFVSPIDLDSDHDGVIDTIEDAGPNSGDANNDGIADKYQTKVTTYLIDGTDTYTTLVNAGCSENAAVSGLSASSLNTTDTGFDYPYGLTDFMLQCQLGESANIDKYVFTDTPTDGFTVRKYRPGTDTYEDVPGAIIASETIGSTQALKLTYSITDGGALDDDGIVNGLISDPVGLAIVHTDSQQIDNGSSGGSSGTSGSEYSASGTLATTGTQQTGSQISYALLLLVLGTAMVLLPKRRQDTPITIRKIFVG